MTLTSENILLLGSILLFLSIIASKTSYRVGVPALIMFLLLGMLAGSDGPGGIYFNDPKLTQFIGVIALNFILFSGAIDTKYESVQPVLKQGILLSTIGVLLTATVVGLCAYWLADIPLLESFLLGSIVSSTDAAAVFSILRGRSVGLKRNLRPMLELESGSNDPMAYVLTISLLSFYGNTEQTVLDLLLLFLQQMLIGAGLGFLLGKGIVLIVNKISLDVDGLYPVLVTALVLFTFSITDFVGGNGFLAIYISGLLVGNAQLIHKKTLIQFYDGIAWLMQIIMFLTLGLLVFPSQILPILGIGILIAAVLMFVARPIGVFISLAAFRIPFRDKLFISWVGLRGAVPIVFATYPLLAGVESAGTIFHIVFFITVTSVLLQGTTLTLVAKWLHLTVPEKVRKKSLLEMELIDDFKSELFEVDIQAENKSAGKSIVQLNFPKGATIVMINRNGKFIRPGGSTVLNANDKLLVMANDKETINKVFDSLR
ncbi:MAG: potassium/proton antiporter [Flammeovirgaceae bacterium]|nr:MAG: potassium/proton antiporter [Flammeovirgaceae bacterium]